MRLPSRAPASRNWAWLGLLPFVAFLFLFLIIPAISVFKKALQPATAFGLTAIVEAFKGQNRNAFWFSIKFSLVAACVGVVLGTAARLRRRHRARARAGCATWSLSFSGVAANMGGIPLAFAFFALLGRQGVAHQARRRGPRRRPLRQTGSDSTPVPGLIVVYSYFNIPLMVLVTLPAIDGLKPSWREATANLGGTDLDLLAPGRPAGAGALDARRLPAAVRQLLQRLRHGGRAHQPRRASCRCDRRSSSAAT